MTTWQTRTLCAYLRATRKRRYATAARGRERLAHGSPPVAPPGDLRGRLCTEQVGGFPLDVVRPPDRRAPSTGALVYFHGGAFVNGITGHHWKLISHLSEATGADVYVPRYGLAPHHDVDDARELLVSLGRRLHAAGPLHVMGDSAGGNLALLLALRPSSPSAHSPGPEPTVSGLTLIAPWLDLSMSNPGCDAVEPHDPWLTRAGLRPIAEAWAGRHDLRDPEVSPLFADVTALPPTTVLVGTRDITLPDCRELRERAGSVVTLHEAPGSPHVHPLLPTPEGRAARELLVRAAGESLAR